MLRRITIAATLAATLAAVGAPNSTAHDGGNLCHKGNYLYKQVQHLLSKRAPGRNICEDGLKDNKPASDKQKGPWVARLRSMVAQATAPEPQPVETQGSQEPQQASSDSGGSTAGSGLDSIAQCESGGDPSAVSPDGTYRGKYQFDQGTWESVGGSGDPAAASEDEQDQRAAMLQARSGNNPWPVCGR